jgi:predicted O-methyltransferase YrrM
MRIRRSDHIAEAYGLAAGVGAGLVVALATVLGLGAWSAVVPVAVIVAVVVASGVRTRRTARAAAARQDAEFAKHRKAVLERLKAIRAGVHEAQVTAAFSAMAVPYPLPLGGFALDQEVAALLAREVATGRPAVVVELGSGTSTAIIGLQLARLGHGHLYSLEHDPAFARRTLGHVRALGLESAVSVLEAPLVPTPVGPETYRWYRLPPEVAALERIDLLLVDGPPQATDPDGTPRYPAFPLLEGKLGPGSVVFVDDMVREAEQAMLERWTAERPELAIERFQTRHGLAIVRYPDAG